ncbi:GIY-YIG nuclease family protein [Pseudomaricurvus alkylphenolicus]|uniref:GIY-YIG nuclease family protein n=1 Tax=Pseudomaricurvus alkylphenolicus TaxID=1306991 RepID=UPI0014219AD9|nr:GIY-YIG nuclease family protein [Pseudomaricurvus alkylphenolicus]NIB39082.1 GIY-YIG nuclease family protein [Pseudomaricurvus alkylphenolicus]
MRDQRHEQIGKKYTTPTGSTITIVGMNGKTGKNHRFVLHCSVCSDDTELFPELLAKKAYLDNDQFPCNCGTRPLFSETQRAVLVSREAKKRGLTFLGFKPPYEGTRSHLRLSCPEHGDYEGIRYGDFMRGQRGCKRCKTAGRSKRAKSAFVGTTFDTPNGGVLTVKEPVGKYGSYLNYEVHCSICSADKELWPVISCIKTRLESGYIPCGCNDRWMPTRDQYIVQAKREAARRGLIFDGMVNESFTKITKAIARLRCPDHGPIEVSLRTLLKRDSDTCRKCVDVKSAAIEAKRVIGEKFHTPVGSTLEIIGWNGETGAKKHYFYECSVCSSDSELFPELRSRYYRVRDGSYPCGCSESPSWTEEQNKIRVQRVADSRGYLFHGWAEEYNCRQTRLLLECPEHGIWRTSGINHFTLRGQGCPACGGTGYNPCELGYLYVLRSDEKGGIIKVGISNELDSRIARLKRKTPFDFEIMNVLECTDGNIPRLLETEAKRTLTSAQCSGFDGFSEWFKNDDIFAEWIDRISDQPGITPIELRSTITVGDDGACSIKNMTPTLAYAMNSMTGPGARQLA